MSLILGRCGELSPGEIGTAVAHGSWSSDCVFLRKLPPTDECAPARSSAFSEAAKDLCGFPREKTVSLVKLIRSAGQWWEGGQAGGHGHGQGVSIEHDSHLLLRRRIQSPAGTGGRENEYRSMATVSGSQNIRVEFLGAGWQHTRGQSRRRSTTGDGWSEEEQVTGREASVVAAVLAAGRRKRQKGTVLACFSGNH
jgi:hypothetical protein